MEREGLTTRDTHALWNRTSVFYKRVVGEAIIKKRKTDTEALHGEYYVDTAMSMHPARRHAARAVEKAERRATAPRPTPPVRAVAVSVMRRTPTAAKTPRGTITLNKSLPSLNQIKQPCPSSNPLLQCLLCLPSKYCHRARTMIPPSFLSLSLFANSRVCVCERERESFLLDVIKLL